MSLVGNGCTGTRAPSKWDLKKETYIDLAATAQVEDRRNLAGIRGALVNDPEFLR
mgnify:CR=1 FL=1